MKINLDKEPVEYTEPEVKEPENKKESYVFDIVTDIGEGIWFDFRLRNENDKRRIEEVR